MSQRRSYELSLRTCLVSRRWNIKSFVCHPFRRRIWYPIQFLFKKKTDGNPLHLVKGKMIARFSIKSKANIPRRLNGRTRTATLTLELMAVWSPYFKSKRRLYKQIWQWFNAISQSLFQRIAIIRILMENSSFVDCFPLRIRYTRRHILSLLIHCIRELSWQGNWFSAFLIWKSSNPRKWRENMRRDHEGDKNTVNKNHHENKYYL